MCSDYVVWRNYWIKWLQHIIHQTHEMKFAMSVCGGMWKEKGMMMILSPYPNVYHYRCSVSCFLHFNVFHKMFFALNNSLVQNASTHSQSDLLISFFSAPEPDFLQKKKTSCWTNPFKCTSSRYTFPHTPFSLTFTF